MDEIITTMSNTTAPPMTDTSQLIPQVWHPTFVVFAYAMAFVSSYAAVHLLDHRLWFWRSDELRKNSIIKHPDIYASVILGVGTVWCMHFVGMGAVTLEATPICYDWPVTLGSLAAVVCCMLAGIKVAGKDVFATPERDEILEQILKSKYTTANQEGWNKFKVTAGHKLHYILMGSFLAASGAVIMHYTGMMAQRGAFRKEWDFGLIATSIVFAIVICFVGFWIMFRLRWNIQQLWLRYASAAVIGTAVCGLHFFGMLSVTYYPDPDSHDVCIIEAAGPNAWNIHQKIVIALAIAVLLVNFLVESAINQELLLAYEAAAQSSEIVANLFPAQVRDRLLADGKRRKRKNHKTSPTDSPEDSHNEGSDSAEDPHEEDDLGQSYQSNSDPIAEYFTDTSVLFADLAGFTKWSSTREPAQVFILLETLYQAFDKIAERRHVFKIETIGDCYVAATGLPNPQADHAVILTKFARDCQFKMNQIITGNIVNRLGEDTMDLAFRVGIHSGPITGGVLRGQKARFQLFGDTMNTASRMETNGVKGKIHVSEATAAELRKHGKGHWLQAREDLIEAKGKGVMQTYFVQVGGDASTDDGRSLRSGTDMSASFDASNVHKIRNGLGHNSFAPNGSSVAYYDYGQDSTLLSIKENSVRKVLQGLQDELHSSQEVPSSNLPRPYNNNSSFEV